MHSTYVWTFTRYQTITSATNFISWVHKKMKIVDLFSYVINLQNNIDTTHSFFLIKRKDGQ